MGQLLTKRPEKASYTASRTFARRCKHLMKNGFFTDQFNKALKAEGVSLEFGPNGLQFTVLEPVPEPTHKELLDFWRKHQEDKEEVT